MTLPFENDTGPVIKKKFLQASNRFRSLGDCRATLA